MRPLAEAPRAHQPTAVAYLVSQYPALSHTFIEREVASLRASGVPVHTVSVRPCPPEQLASAAMRAEAATTTVLLDGDPRRYALAHARLATMAPREWTTTLTRALRTGDRTARARVWQGFYFAEAVLLMEHLRRLQIRHIHVHFANVAADVARLTVHLGRLLDGPHAGWAWSMAMHGPTEFEAVDRVDLPAKVRSATAVACISDFCRSQLMRLVEPEHWDKLRIVRMAIDTDRFSAPDDDRSGRRGQPLRVLTVGRLVPEKGAPVLLDAVAALRNKGLPVMLRMVGAGPMRDHLRDRVDQLGLAGLVTLTGPVGPDDILEHYHWADVFCLPSFQEGLPVVLMEAMATELPVVTTRIAGIPELVQHGRSGWVVAPGRADLIATALTEVAGDPQRAREQGRTGRLAVLDRHVPEVTTPDLLALFEEFTPGFRSPLSHLPRG